MLVSGWRGKGKSRANALQMRTGVKDSPKLVDSPTKTTFSPILTFLWTMTRVGTARVVTERDTRAEGREKDETIIVRLCSARGGGSERADAW